MRDENGPLPDDRAARPVTHDVTIRVRPDATPDAAAVDDTPRTATDATPDAAAHDTPRTGTGATPHAVSPDEARTRDEAPAPPAAHGRPRTGADADAYAGAASQATTATGTPVPTGAAATSTASGPGTGVTGPDTDTDGRAQAVPGDTGVDAAAPGPAPTTDGPTGDDRTADGPTDDTSTDVSPSSDPGDALRPAPDRHVPVPTAERPTGPDLGQEEPRRVARGEEDSVSTRSAATDPAEEDPAGSTATPTGSARTSAAPTDNQAPGTADADATDTHVPGTPRADAATTTTTPTATTAPATTSTATTPTATPPTGPTAGGRGAPEQADTSTVRADAGPVPEEPADGPADPRTPESGPAADIRADLPDDEPAPARQVDPERALAAVDWRLHPETLREEAPDPAELRRIRDGLTGKLDTALDNRSRARLLSLRAVASRVIGDADDAVADARLALTYAEATGELRRTALARARLAEVLRWRGEYAEADRLFAEANSAELPDRLRALLHEHAGRCCYDQGRLTEACLHFERALDLRRGEDAALNARTLVALDAVAARAARDGFGPAPRGRAEVLGTPRYPVATYDEEQQLWGYADADGELVIGHRYAEVQPFHEGVAWVRRPEASRWALIDTTGAALIEANNGYRAVGVFAEGLSWVSMDGKGRWMAVDRTNIVKIPPGYEEVRPFRNGLAAVRQNGGWGAVDRAGEVVVPTRYHGLGTSLADGRHLDGFTEEGLAVVELAGRRGVVDRNGRVRVAPAYPTLVIHPVAFLVTTEAGRWGALDRHGEPLIDPVHPGRAAVAAEIDRLLADASPVL
ncbi:WG repeat-containing protein [Micromonospora sp. NPDC018662]|uniref:WG repeat-containing protein n=1 Tax=Micromonospora sp. NPDC018662 TaxID=3364238 RepID=UPI0037A91BC3